jgi:hypothetical protein
MKIKMVSLKAMKAYGKLSNAAKLRIITAVGTTTKSGSSKNPTLLYNEAMKYFITNVYNK